MNRKNTIVVAVLVNAVLLMTLFVTAMRSEGEKSTKEEKGITIASCVETAPQPLPPKQESPKEHHSTRTVVGKKEPEESLYLGEELIIPPSVTETVVASTPPLKEPVEASIVNITVKKGDVLEKIARANGTTVSAIMRANQLTTTNLRIGQVLKVPLVKKETSPPVPSVQEEKDFYIVKEGDNPWLIASKNNLKTEELLRLNGLDEQKARRLRPGDRLKIR